MRALVTGATGFVGSAVARALLQQGWEVRALVRRGSLLRNLQSLSAEIVTGDLADRASLERALTDCAALFHVAADYRLGVRDPEQLYRTNVEGTRCLLQAAQAGPLTRVVYTSSVATIGLPADGSPGREDTPVTLEDMIGHYKRSKFLAEAVVRESAQSGTPVIIVNPSTPIGPGDIKPTPTGQMVLDAAMAVCRPMSTPDSTSCTSTTSPPDICWRMITDGSASVTSWRRGHVPARDPGRDQPSGGPGPPRIACRCAAPAHRLCGGTVARITGGSTRITVESCAWRESACTFRAIKRRGSSATDGDRRAGRSRMRCAGFASSPAAA